MTFLPALHFFCLLMYAYMAGLVLYKGPKSTLNRACSALLFCFAIWNFSDMFSHNPGIEKDTVMLFQNISSIGWLGYPIALLCFSLAFSKHERIMRTRTFIAIAPILPLLLLYKQWTDCLTIDLVQRPWGWEYRWSDSNWPNIFYAYYITLTFTSIYLVYMHGRRTNRLQEKRQAKTIVACVTISLVIGTISDVVIPEMHIEGVPALANVVLLVFAIGIVYAIIKYKFLSISPASAAENIISSMEELLILLDEDGTIATTNKATSSLLGYGLEELQGKTVEMLLKKGCSSSPLLEGITKSVTTRSAEDVFRKRSGEEIPILFSCSSLKDEQGIMVGTVIVAKDLTEHKKSEEEKYRLKTQLLQSEKLAAVGQLGAGVAHELNNPLGVILGFAQGMEKRVPDGDPLRLPVTSIMRETLRCKHLVQGLLTFVRTAKESREPVDLNELIRSSVILFESRSKTQGVQIVRKLAEDLPAVEANRTQLEKVLVNVVTNALDVMNNGGMLTFRTYRNGDSSISIDIVDTGPGIAPTIRARIFEPFFTTKEVGMGAGLGLSLAHEIVQQHRGTIDVQSEVGKGTTMTIRLPVEADGGEPVQSVNDAVKS